MKLGTTKTGKIHIFTDKNECLCDLNIHIKHEVSEEYTDIKSVCLNCLHIKSIHHLKMGGNINE